MSPDATPVSEPANQSNHQMAVNPASIYSRFSLGASAISMLKWRPTSFEDLARAESELLAAISRPLKAYFVDIGPGWGMEKNEIRTVELLTDAEIEKKTPKEEKQPLVMVHGFGSGIGTWILNFDPLASTIGRKIYAIDLMGFGRSTRAPFDLTGDIEGQFVDSIERWRAKQGIEKFIILGHSFGGYLSADYALRYPDRVSHVILADPWGVQSRPSSATRETYRFPLWLRAASSIFQYFNPLAALRISGPYGPSLVYKLRGDLREKFRPKLGDDCDKFLSYIYHCNAQSATGESAFKALTHSFGWPKHPLIHRILEIDPSINLTFIYGSRSWIDHTPGEFIRDCLTPNRVTVKIIHNSGHHVYADNYNEFNEIVREATRSVES